jgi:hypothetical protein
MDCSFLKLLITHKLTINAVTSIEACCEKSFILLGQFRIEAENPAIRTHVHTYTQTVLSP